MRFPQISVAIPVGPGDTPAPALESLGRQIGVDLELCIVHDPQGRGANWARNVAVKQLCSRDLILFSDADIEWEREAVYALWTTLHAHPEAAYAYGCWEMNGRVQCTEAFDFGRLKRGNFISTMSLVRRETFPGFDETIGRLQDWDLWLTMGARGHFGVQSGRLIFKTKERDGITKNGPVDWATARAAIAAKHGLAR